MSLHSAYYVMPQGPPEEGEQVATGLGWVNWSAWVLDHHGDYPEAAHLAQEGWLDGEAELASLEHELERILHEAGDPNLTAIAAQVLAAVRSKPEGALGILVSDGEPGDEGDEASESVVREEGEPPFPGAVFDKSKHRWVKGTDAGDTKDAAAGTPELPEEDKKDITDAIDQHAADQPDDQKPPAGLIAKAKGVALTALAKAHLWAFKAHPAMEKIGAALGAYFDTPDDMKKLGYNPGNTAQTAGPRTHDAVSNAINDAIGIGISGHLVAKIASVVIVKAGSWVAKKARGEAVETGDGFAEWADMISQLFAHLNEQMGVADGAPDAATVEKAIRSMLAGKI